MKINDKIENNKTIGVGSAVKILNGSTYTYRLVVFDEVFKEYCLLDLSSNRITYRSGGLEYILEFLNKYDWYKVNAEVTIIN